MEDDEEFEEQKDDDRNIGHTIGQPSVNAGVSRNLLHTNSIASTSNILPVGSLLRLLLQSLLRQTKEWVTCTNSYFIIFTPNPPVDFPAQVT